MASSITQARQGTLYLMCGGRRDVFDRAAPLLKALSAHLRYIGPAGEAANVKALAILREIARNPLIVATIAGLAANLAGLQWPDAVATALQRIGLAALPLGLMAVGAGLKFGGLTQAPGLAAALLAIRHLALPAVAIGLCIALALAPEQRLILVAFAAVGTAPTAYVLAARMGGEASFVAGIVTLSTLLSAASVPLSLALLRVAG